MFLEHNSIRLENNKIKTKFGNFKKHTFESMFMGQCRNHNENEEIL